MNERQIMGIQETVQKSKSVGLPISEYTLRRALRTGAIPCRRVGRTYLIAWKNVENWLLCSDGADNTPPMGSNAGIRRLEVDTAI